MGYGCLPPMDRDGTAVRQYDEIPEKIRKNMKLTCPFCNNKFSVDEAARSETLCNLTQELSRFGKHCALIWEYTGAFATKRLGPIAPAKRLRIVTELTRLWETGIFQIDGKRYKIDRAGIVAGMTTVCNLEKFGLPNHNYLKKVLRDKAERVSAEGLTAGEEQKKIEDQKERRSEGRKAEEAGEVLSPKALKQFKEKMGVTKISELMHPGRLTQRERDEIK